MASRDNSYEAWTAEREACEAWCALVDASMPAFERVIPRDSAEARCLRGIGTPECLIGPECRDDDPTLQPDFWSRMGPRELVAA